MTLLLAVSALAGESLARKHHKHIAPNDFQALAFEYFRVWNTHDVSALESLLAEDATLRDWDIHKSGAGAIAAANGGIFAALPNIQSERVLYLVCVTGPVCNEHHQVRLAETCSRLPHAVEVVTIHVSEATAAAACEILVKLNNGAAGAAQELKVVDVISFDGTGKIKSIRACERHLPSNSFPHHSAATLSGSACGPM